MFWNKSISGIEQTFFLIFGFIYIVYLAKVIYIGRTMKLTNRAVYLKILPRLLVIALLVAALLEPTFGLGDETGTASKNVPRDNMVLLDVSRSMDAADIAPSRLLKAKNELKKLIGNFTSDRFGLICFASQATLVSPLSNDKSNILELIDFVKTQQSGSQGTNIKEAIDLAIEKHTANNNSSLAAKTILLITDGEDFSDLDDRTFNNLKRNQIKLIMLGIGTTKGDNLYTENGQKLTDKNNKIVVTKLQDEYLNTLAQKSNGSYINLNQAEKASNKLVNTLEAHTSSRQNNYFSTLNNANKYQYAILFALVILLLDILLSIRIFEF
jgi:Ca-activated chloride channel homolog